VDVGEQLLRQQQARMETETKLEEGGGMYGKTAAMFSARTNASSVPSHDDDGGAAGTSGGDEEMGDEDDAELRLKQAKRAAKEKAKEKGTDLGTHLLESGMRVDPEQRIIVRQRQMQQEALMHTVRMTRRKGAG